jgi:hypothetical protein
MEQQHVDGCSVGSIRGSPAFQQDSSRVVHLLCRLHSEVAQWKQQHVDGCSVDSI